jgi:hypothetical protein
MPNTSRLDGQRGEGKLQSILTLAVLAGFVFAAWNVAPVYFANYELKDKMREIARLGKGQNPDDRIMERLLTSVRENGLEEWVTKSNFTITTRESSRRIVLDYERKAKVLPGFERTFKFHEEVDEPFF